MERIEDKSKALSYIGIEIAEALKQIPIPVNYSEYVKRAKSKRANSTNSKSTNTRNGCKKNKTRQKI